MRAAKYAPRDAFRILERGHGLAAIAERCGVVLVERQRVIRPRPERQRRAPPPPETQRLIDVASSWTQLPQYRDVCNVTIKLWSYEEALAEARRYDPRSAAAPES